MNLIELLPTSRLGLRGVTQKPIPGSSKQSTLHKTSSINNNPNITRQASNLDLNGKTPEKYTDTVVR